MTKKKLLIIAAANNFHFIHAIAEAMRDEFDVLGYQMSRTLTNTISIYDIVWLEWMDGIAISALLIPKSNNTKYIVRLHRYELFTPRTLKLIQDITDSGDYKKIDKLVFVSNFIREIGIKKFPWMKEISVVIPNLFDHTKFPMAENKKKGYNLLFLGRVSYVKNLPLCLTMFHELLKLDSNYKLHVVGEIADPELKYYAENFISKTKIQDNIVWHGRTQSDELPSLMVDMSYIICSSIFESQGMGIIEGMSCGLKPLIFDFPGAEYIYPAKWRWIDRTDFIYDVLHSCNPQEYRNYVIDRFSIEKNIDRYKNLINEVLEEK